MILSAHQPNFMPWMPYFDKIGASDVFVILGHAQYVKGNFHNRFSLGERWYTMSVRHSKQPISEMKFAQPQRDWQKINDRLPEYSSTLGLFADQVSESMLSTNVGIIQKAMSLLPHGFPEVFMEQKTSLKGSGRLLQLCIDYGASTYLSGPSGARYLDLDSFHNAGIKVEFFESRKEPNSLLEFLRTLSDF